ncbi:MAG: M23 family metallopeptidase [Candidatus Margulisiibacteriota bacterium]
MDKNNKKERFYSIMIVPHDAKGHPVSIKVPAKLVYGLVGLFLFSFILAGSSIVYSTLISRRMISYSDVISKNSHQQKMLSEFSDKTEKVSAALEALAKEESDIRKQLGIKDWKSKININTASKESLSDSISMKLKLADAKVNERKTSLKEIKAWVSTVREKLANTPSGWPVRGNITSFFGYRTFPWRGFHAGIDLDVPYGTPVASTAPGEVSFTGWERGYGMTVKIDHGQGVSTLYAHNSMINVMVGQKIKKGQTIAFVGTTGQSTGPHCHYEVLKNLQPVNPMVFLKLDILSASKLWGNGYGTN